MNELHKGIVIASFVVNVKDKTAGKAVVISWNSSHVKIGNISQLFY